MKIIYLILVEIILSCNSATETKPSEIVEREISGTYIEVKPSGNTVVVTHYSDSTKTVVNLDSEGKLLDSTFFYKP